LSDQIIVEKQISCDSAHLKYASNRFIFRSVLNRYTSALDFVFLRAR
jgi:hypothetical protein